MRIVIPTIGTRGDVQPFIALSQGLTRAGHTVILASHPMMRALVKAHGIDFAPIGPDIDLAQEVADIRLRSRSTIVGLMRGMRFSFEKLEQSHEDILALCQKADLIVVPSQSAAGKNEADQLKLPYLSVNFTPWGIPWDDPKRPFYKRITYRTIDHMVSLLTTRPLNRMRKQQGLSPVGSEGFNSPCLNLVPISPAIYAPNPRWESHHRLVGYWFAAEPDGWQPPPDLLTFIESGESPLVVSLGAMSLGSVNERESAALFIDAIRQTGVRAIIQGWERGMKQLSLPKTIYTAGSLPHSWLLPLSKGLVHHGGFGTTSAGLRAGIPAFIIPHVIDQFYWGQRIYELGAGPRPVPRSKLNLQGLAAALIELTQDGHLYTAASSLGKQIRAEHGLEDAVSLIEETFG